MSEFGDLRIALSALYAQQRGLEVTGHNIANVGTSGYSRQRVETSANAGPIVPAFFARWPGSGLGVDVDAVTRLHDTFLEARSLLAHGTQGNLQRTDSVLARVELTFPEPSNNGLGALLSDFWAGWNDVANNPGDQSARTQLLERARAVTSGLAQAAGELDTLRDSSIEELSTVVDEVNLITASIATLNGTIRNAAVANLAHNDLLDQRDQLVRRLADLVGATTKPDGEMLNVFVGGGAIVRGEMADALVVDVGPVVTVRFQKDNYPAGIGGGDAGGLLGALNDILPRYRAGLDTIATTLRDAVNAVHGALTGTIAVASQNLTAAGTLSFGLRVNGVATPDVTLTGADYSGVGGAAALQGALQTALDTATGAAGTVVATVTGGNGAPLQISLAPGAPTDTITVNRVAGNAGLGTLLSTVAVGLDGVGGRAFFTGTGAGDLAIASDVAASPDAIGAAFAGGGPLDAGAALRIGDLVGDPLGADARYRAFVVGLGVEKQAAARRVEVQNTSTQQIDAARDSQSGVNLDEEMVSMLGYQHAYSAAARYMTAIDEMLDTLVHRTGVSGR